MIVSQRKAALLAAVLLCLATLSGCGDAVQSSAGAGMTEEATGAVSASNPLAESGLDEQQLNSINMLNYLAVLTQEIESSKYSRLYLEEAYSTLLNNISPEAIDSRTQEEINCLLNTLESYRMLAIKRERLRYLYEQDQAQALREAVPNPAALMSAVRSFDVKRIVTSIVRMPIDCYTGYESGAAQVEFKYLQDGWKLEDEQTAILHEIRKGTFNYMVETVREYDLPGELALTEKAVSEFVEWKNKSNRLQVIQFFEDNVDTYRAFGPYWLTLAECYYENEEYEKCLEAISSDEQLQPRIFRRDYSYARVLPLGLAAAGEAYDQELYQKAAVRYAEGILKNTDNEDWTLRYFAAQTYHIFLLFFFYSTVLYIPKVFCESNHMLAWFIAVLIRHAGTELKRCIIALSTRQTGKFTPISYTINIFRYTYRMLDFVHLSAINIFIQGWQKGRWFQFNGFLCSFFYSVSFYNQSSGIIMLCGENTVTNHVFA